MRLFRLFVALYAFFVVVPAGASVTSGVSVPAEVLVRLTRGQAGDFTGAIGEVARQARVAFVVEGAPLRPVLPEQEAPDLKVSAPVSETVSKLARAYGYVSSRDGDVFRLRKRYDDPRDLPDVTLDECERAAQDIRHILMPFRPQVVAAPGARAGDLPLIGPTALRLFASLTPEQKRRTRGDQGLALNALSSEQQKLVRSMALYLYVQTALTDVESFAAYLRRAKVSAVLTMKLGAGNSARSGGEGRFGYEVPGPKGDLYFSAFDEGIAVPPLSQAPTNAEADTAFVGSESLNRDSVSLGQLVEQLTERGPARVTVDDALRARRVLLFGGEAVFAAQVLKAVAFVQGLRVVPGENGSLRLARPTVRVPASVALLPGALRLAVPEPLRRAALPDPEPMSLSTAEELNQKLEAARSDEERQALLQQRREQQQWARRNRKDRAARLLALRKAAGQRLFMLSRPEREKPGGDGRVPVAALTEPGRNLFAVALMAPLLNGLQFALRQQPPRYITQFDQLSISTESTKNPITGRFDLAVYLALREPRTGELHNVGGVGSLKDQAAP